MTCRLADTNDLPPRWRASDDPPVAAHRIGKRLLPPMDDRFCARRGTYRVIYRIDDKARVVTVVDVAHRRDVYRT
jgi:mRNA-degrading endonuclease RelE of RelBE toxin-antitoxin system